MGFPHSEISGSKCIGNSPELIAAYHVLHRLSVPRHPPNALVVLDSTTVCQRNNDPSIVASARSVQGTTPGTTASLPFPATPSGKTERGNLDFKDLILPMNDVKEQ